MRILPAGPRYWRENAAKLTAASSLPPFRRTASPAWRADGILAPMRRLAAALLSALLAASGMPVLGTAAGGCSQGAAAGAPAAGTAAGIAAAHRHGADCRMSCCVVRPAAASRGCRCGRSQPRQPAGFAAGMPSILPAPPRLPLPRGAALAWLQPGLPAALPFLGIPERPPRA
jgi:hypothetical protein